MRALFLLLNCVLCVNGASDLLVETSKGSVLGYSQRASDLQRARIFKGIPLAAPPIGPLRFALPQPANRWEGVRDASEYGPACISHTPYATAKNVSMSEDCLYINLFVGERCTTATLCPVIVYLQPGNNNFDSAVDINDTHIVDRYTTQGVIFVAPAFRMGIFGLLEFADDAVVPRNLAFYDMIHALRWVQTEIGAFGGDRERVTIMVLSAGGEDALALSLSQDLSIPGRPWSGGKLFHKIASLSGTVEAAPSETQRRATAMAAVYANCTSSPLLSPSPVQTRLLAACLRTLTWTQLADISWRIDEEMGHVAFRAYTHSPPLFHSKDIIPNLRDPPSCDLLLGGTSHEWGWSAGDRGGKGYGKIVQAEEKTGELIAIQNVDEFSEKFEADVWRFEASYLTQAVFASNYVVASAMRQRHPESKVYLYQLDNAQNHHASDLYFLVGAHPRDLNEEDQLVMDMYSNMFIEFAKYGRPATDAVAFEPSKGNYYSIQFNTTAGVKPHMKEGYHYNIVNYWLDELVEFDRNVSLSKGMNVNEDYPIVNVMPLLYATPEGIDLSSTTELIPGSPKSNALIYLIIFTVVVVVFIIVGCIWCRKSPYERIQ